MIRTRRDCGSLEANSVIIKATEVTKPLQRHCLCPGTRTVTRYPRYFLFRRSSMERVILASLRCQVVADSRAICKGLRIVRCDENAGNVESLKDPSR